MVKLINVDRLMGIAQKVVEKRAHPGVTGFWIGREPDNAAHQGLQNKRRLTENRFLAQSKVQPKNQHKKRERAETRSLKF